MSILVNLVIQEYLFASSSGSFGTTKRQDETTRSYEVAEDKSYSPWISHIVYNVIIGHRSLGVYIYIVCVLWLCYWLCFNMSPVCSKQMVSRVVHDAQHPSRCFSDLYPPHCTVTPNLCTHTETPPTEKRGSHGNHLFTRTASPGDSPSSGTIY